MACCEEHPVKAFSLTLAGAGKYVPIRCLPYILHFIDGDSWEQADLTISEATIII
jgi:hypothetical protein